MAMTVLEIVQDILSDLGSDNVNSINDTVTSLRVARIVKSTYDNLMAEKEWPHQTRMFAIESIGDGTRPTILKLPDTLAKIVWLTYNKETSELPHNYEKVTYLEPDAFFAHTNARDSSDSNIDVEYTLNNIPLLIQNDKHPDYYTVLEDTYLVFDSYDSDYGSTVVASECQAYGKFILTLTLADATVPDIPEKYFPWLLSECKSAAFIKIRETQSPTDERNSARNRAKHGPVLDRLTRKMRYPDYGRKSSKTDWNENP